MPLQRTHHSISDLLEPLRRKLRLQAFVSRLGLAGAVAAGVFLCWHAVMRFAEPGLSGFGRLAPWIAIAAVTATAVVAAVVHRVRLEDVAVRADRALSNRDELLTGLRLEQEPLLGPVAALALDSCRRFARAADLDGVVRLRMPRTYLVLAILLALLAALAGLGDRGGPDPGMDAARPAASEVAESLEQLADSVGAKDVPSNDPELQRLVQEMKEAAGRIEQTRGEPAHKQALKELSSLEEQIKKMMEAAAAGGSRRELEALARALQADPRLAAAGALLAGGAIAEAVNRMQSILEQLKQSGQLEQAMSQLAESFQREAGALSPEERGHVSEQMERAARAAQAGGGLNDEEMQRLAQLLSKLGGGQDRQPQQGQGGNQAGRQMTLRELLDALEQMKQAARSGADPGQGRLGLSLNQPGEGSAQEQDGTGASGQPGSEFDRGTGGNPEGTPGGRLAEHGPAERLAGALAAGESAWQALPTVGGSPGARQAYRELYNRMAPAAEDAVLKENVPLGSRLLVRRYFEGIRPGD